MSAVRKVRATSPDGHVAERTSKSKVYTHALAIHRPAQDSYVIPAGTYAVPAKRIRGRRVPAYNTTVSQDIVVPAQEESYSIVSFHTSGMAATKAGNTFVNQTAAAAAEEREVYGVDARASVTGFRVVEVEVLDEGFNAALVGKSQEQILAERAARVDAIYGGVILPGNEDLA